MDVVSKVGEFVSRPIKLPGFITLLLGAISLIPDWKARWDFWISTFQSDSMLSHVVVSVLVSPYLGVILIIFGLVYLYFARGVVHVHHGDLSAGIHTNGDLAIEVHRNTEFWPMRDLFAYIHPQKFSNDAERDAVGRAVIDQISSGQLAVWGRRIDGSVRAALEPIPSENWKHAKFTYWFMDEGSEQSLHVDCPIYAGQSSPARQYADLRVNREQAEKIWSYIPLKDAARIAYERARESASAKVAERFGKTSEGILHYLSSTIFLYFPVYARRPPSTIRELLPQELRPSMRVFDDCDGIGYVSDKCPTYVGALVTSSDLEAFIQWAREATLQADPG